MGCRTGGMQEKMVTGQDRTGCRIGKMKEGKDEGMKKRRGKEKKGQRKGGTKKRRDEEKEGFGNLKDSGLEGDMKRGIHDWSYAGLERYRKECSRQE